MDSYFIRSRILNKGSGWNSSVSTGRLWIEGVKDSVDITLHPPNNAGLTGFFATFCLAALSLLLVVWYYFKELPASPIMFVDIASGLVFAFGLAGLTWNYAVVTLCKIDSKLVTVSRFVGPFIFRSFSIDRSNVRAFRTFRYLPISENSPSTRALSIGNLGFDNVEISFGETRKVIFRKLSTAERDTLVTRLRAEGFSVYC